MKGSSGQASRSAMRNLRDVSTLATGQAGRALIQGAYFVLVARGLGAEGYGNAAIALAGVGLLAPFIGLGAGILLMRRLARAESDIDRDWTNLLCVVGLSGLAASGVVIVLAKAIFPTLPLVLVLAVCLADLLATPLLSSVAQAYQGE